jgi:hypothetical protein
LEQQSDRSARLLRRSHAVRRTLTAVYLRVFETVLSLLERSDEDYLFVADGHGIAVA